MKNPRRSTRITSVVALVALLLIASRWYSSPPAAGRSAAATPAPVTPEANVNPAPKVDALLAKIARVPDVADAAPSPVRLGTQESGAIRFIGLERGWRLPAAESHVPGDPAETALRFVLANRPAFGLANPRVDLTIFRTTADVGRSFVRLQQTYGKIPVLAAETVVQVSNAGDIECVLADMATRITNLDTLPLPLAPTLAEPEASARAVGIVRTEMRRGPVKAGAAQLVIYVPDVLGLPGEPALAWEVPVISPAQPVRAKGRVIVHAGTGALLNYLDEIHSATDRRIYDDNSSTTTEPTLGGMGDNPVRVEGGPATGIADVDNLYDYIGQTDAFYLAANARNGYNGAGARIFAIARDVPPGQTSPWGNASAGGNVMQFGVGFVSDDIVAHEYTHLVTGQTSRLIYQNTSGAINEALSDIWGEFVDFSNTGQTPNGNDSAAVRWEVGEDRPAGPLRSMRDPGDLLRPAASRRFSDPDRLSSSNYKPIAIVPNGAAGGNDAGGVHSNSGVLNKLAYLLTDGDSFNGQTITPEGSGNVATLLYQVQTALLVPAADWRDLYFAITQAAANLWSAPRQINVNRACSAVEISTSSHDYFVDRSSPVVTAEPVPRPIQQVGIPNVVGDLGPFRSIQAGINAVNDGGTLRVKGDAGTYNMGGVFNFTKPMTIQTYNAPTTIAP